MNGMPREQPWLRGWRGSLASLAALFLSAGLLAAPGVEGSDGWDLLRQLRFTEARMAFAGAVAHDPWEEIGHALALLNAPPKTRTRLAQARRIFEGIAESADPDLQVTARYYLARIAQVHAYEPDWPEARRRYEELLRDHPAHPLAQLGAAKIALLELYDPANDRQVVERFAVIARLGDGLTDAAARRDFHYVLGCAAVYHRLPDHLALHHLLASRDAGLTNDVNRANVFIRIAETARAMGEAALAREHYELFLAVAPRDVRTRYARERLAELQVSEGGAR